MLYRAFAYSTAPHAPDTEQAVFIDAANEREAARRLGALLSVLWGVPADSIDYYNLSSELELIDQSIGGAATGDARFLETGSSAGRPTYTHAAPFFLVSHAWHMRLMCAWASLQSVARVRRGADAVHPLAWPYAPMARRFTADAG